MYQHEVWGGRRRAHFMVVVIISLTLFLISNYKWWAIISRHECDESVMCNAYTKTNLHGPHRSSQNSSMLLIPDSLGVLRIMSNRWSFLHDQLEALIIIFFTQLPRRMCNHEILVWRHLNYLMRWRIKRVNEAGYLAYCLPYCLIISCSYFDQEWQFY